MNKAVIGFFIGAIAGAAGSWLYFKKEYDRKAKKLDEEIEDMKKYHEKKASEQSLKTEEKVDISETSEDESEEEETPVTESDIPDYGRMFKNVETMYPPRVITPDEFYDETSYEKVTLTYYAGDRILADDDGYMVEDVENLVGNDWINRFNEYTEGVVYVRNDAHQCDYEILYVDTKFTE